jgi:uncharacterized protein
MLKCIIMKKTLASFLTVLAICFSFEKTNAQTTENDPQNAKSDTIKPAPKYEMKQYWFVMLVKGKRRDEIKDTAIINKLQTGHMANLSRLAELGKINVAGPFGDNGNWRGIFIFNVPTKEEVEELLKSDPAIAAGRMDYEIHPWWTAKGTTFK